MPRRFNSAAIWRADGKCASSVKIGFMRSASSSACLLLASLPAVQPPSVWPRALAALRPSLVREEISERSFCASAANSAQGDHARREARGRCSRCHRHRGVWWICVDPDRGIVVRSGVHPVGVHDAEEIERRITDFASRPNGGLIVVGPPSSVASYRDLIVSLAARHHLPAVYATLAFVANGALISYGA